MPEYSPESETVEVALALIWHDGKLLLTRRPEGTHLAGYWEFPGGKIDPGESPESCVEREVFEELGLRVRAGARRETLSHAYPERKVILVPIECTLEQSGFGIARSVEYCWVDPAALPDYKLPPANAALIRKLAGKD